MSEDDQILDSVMVEARDDVVADFDGEYPIEIEGLKGANDEIRDRFFTNMSRRAAEMLREEMEVLGAVRLRDVEKAQQDIVSIARKLEEEGVIVTGAAAGEAYVV